MLYTTINKTINNDTFKSKHRLTPTAFTRNRSLTFANLMLYMINFRKHSNQTELDQFFNQVNSHKKFHKLISKAAFGQARVRLSHTAFVDLNQQLVSAFYNNPTNIKKWHNLRLCAIDGTTIRLPNEQDIVNEFGVQKASTSQADCPMAMASVFYDVLNGISIDSSINQRNTSERECAVKHLEHSNQDDLILYDRGYNGFWLYAYHAKHNKKFCIRTKTKQELVIKDFIASGKKSAIVSFKPNSDSLATCKAKGLPTTAIKLRLVRVNLKNEVEVLVTNLIDDKQYPDSCFKKLYQLRWGIEENYKRLKQWVAVENFSGKSALSVKQDFYSKIVALNMTAFMVFASKKN